VSIELVPVGELIAAAQMAGAQKFSHFEQLDYGVDKTGRYARCEDRSLHRDIKTIN
jgi:hypothetical protein